MADPARKIDIEDLPYWEFGGVVGGLPVRIERGWKRGDPIDYIRKEIPDFKVPPYQGERYQTMVPDTLDIQERAALAVNGLTGPTDELADHDIYFFAFFMHHPPMMQHDADSCCLSKLMEPLPLMRMISGSDFNDHVDRKWMEMTLHQQGPDGLIYWSLKGRPWALHGSPIPERAFEQKYFVVPFYCGRLLSALVLYQLRDGGNLWKETATRLVDGLAALAVEKDGYAYFSPRIEWAERGSTVDPAEEDPLAPFHLAHIVKGLVDVYRLTEYEPAMVLAGKLVRYMVDKWKMVTEDGRFNMLIRPKENVVKDLSFALGSAHFHAHSGALLDILDYAAEVNDTKLIELVRKGYEYGKSGGNVLLGYFPEFVNSNRLEHSEMCEVGDMVGLALKLSELGVGDYWDDADRWIRNMFAEGQLTQCDWIYRFANMGYEETREVDVRDSITHEEYQTTDRVPERNVGAFAGWPKANDWYVGQGMGIMHCCTGNATRAIYYIWEHILRHENGKLRVNLLLNRASPWADIDSHIPYTGQVDVKIKEPVDISIRIPEWVSPQETRCRIGQADRAVTFDGRYARVGRVKAGEVVTMTFPITERTNVTYVEKEKYILVCKGNDVVHIEPPGKYCPLYQREHYRQNATRWKKVERFISDKLIYH